MGLMAGLPRGSHTVAWDNIIIFFLLLLLHEENRAKSAMNEGGDKVGKGGGVDVIFELLAIHHITTWMLL